MNFESVLVFFLLTLLQTFRSTFAAKGEWQGSREQGQDMRCDFFRIFSFDMHVYFSFTQLSFSVKAYIPIHFCKES